MLTLLTSCLLLRKLLATFFVIVLVSGSAITRAQAPPATNYSDVVLHTDGLLVGQFVSGAGLPIPLAEIRMTLADGRAAVATTNSEGGFAFRGIQGAVQLTSADAEQLVRVWPNGTAPPQATPAILLVQRGELARGQHRMPTTNKLVLKTKELMANPLFVAGVVTTAVAVPVAIHNADDDDPATP